MIIGIHGLKRSGKDSVAKWIAESLYPDKIRVDSFAAPLRRFAADTFGVTEENRNDPIQGFHTLNEKAGLTGRLLLQLVGTEVCRAISPEFWVRSLAYRTGLEYEEEDATGLTPPLMRADWDHLVITDVRFENEAQFIKKVGGVMVFVSRFPRSEGGDSHSSESGLPFRYADYCISNHGSFTQLSEAVVSVCDSIKARD